MAFDSGDLADAVVAVLDGLSLSPAPAVRKRLAPMALDGDTFPLVTVSVGDEEAAEVMGRTGATTRRIHRRFPVRVAVIVKNLGKVSGSAVARQWHGQIAVALLDWKAGLVTAGSLPAVNEVEDRGGPVFDRSAAALGYDWSEAVYGVEVATDG